MSFILFIYINYIRICIFKEIVLYDFLNYTFSKNKINILQKTSQITFRLSQITSLFISYKITMYYLQM